MSSAVVEAVIPLADRKRAVAKVQCNGFNFGSIFVVDLNTRPKVSWPKTARGYPIIECIDPELKAEIEDAILAKVRDLG